MVADIDTVKALLETCTKNRHTARIQFNNVSFISHGFFETSIHFFEDAKLVRSGNLLNLRKQINYFVNVISSGQVCIIDLAGSEKPMQPISNGQYQDKREKDNLEKAETNKEAIAIKLFIEDFKRTRKRRSMWLWRKQVGRGFKTVSAGQRQFVNIHHISCL